MAHALSHERRTTLKRIKAGHAGEITMITGILDVLMRDKRNWKEVQVYTERLIAQWGRYLQVFHELIRLIQRESDDYSRKNDNHNKQFQRYQLYMAEIEQFLIDEEILRNGDDTKLAEGSRAVGRSVRSVRIQDKGQASHHCLRQEQA